MVLPWWVASRLPAHFAAAALNADLLVICHNGPTAATLADLPQQAPPDPSSECPICKGLVGLQVAILIAAQAGLLERVAAGRVSSPSSIELHDAVHIAPRNRGPPSFV